MKHLLILFFTLISSFGFAQDKHCNINGVITDSKTNKVIPFATIKYHPTKGVTADMNGKYTLKLNPGKYRLEVSAVGYETTSKNIEIPNLLSSRLIHFKLVEKDIIKNVIGNDSEIPETIYNRIQSNINKGYNVTAILKLKTEDGNSYWTENRFEPSLNNNFKSNFTVSTKITTKRCVEKTQKLYRILNKIEAVHSE